MNTTSHVERETNIRRERAVVLEVGWSFGPRLKSRRRRFPMREHSAEYRFLFPLVMIKNRHVYFLQWRLHFKDPNGSWNCKVEIARSAAKWIFSADLSLYLYRRNEFEKLGREGKMLSRNSRFFFLSREISLESPGCRQRRVRRKLQRGSQDLRAVEFSDAYRTPPRARLVCHPGIDRYSRNSSLAVNASADIARAV